jgi:hypothetical protein
VTEPTLPDDAFAELDGTSSLATPLYDSQDGAARHVDAAGVAHWFAVVERDRPDAASPYELRYFRALELDDGQQRSDSYPVMPLPSDDPAGAWPLPTLEAFLAEGSVHQAQQLAFAVACVHGQDLPAPFDLPDLDPRPEYYFGFGTGPSDAPSLEMVKTWTDETGRRFDTLTLGEYPSFDEAAQEERILEGVLRERGLQAAVHLAESMAVAGGYLDPQRDDPRLFFADDGPPDPFTTLRAAELAAPQYGVGAVSAQGEHFLDVVKAWGGGEQERLIIPQPTWEDALAHAEAAFELQASGDLQAAMRLVEQAGVEAGVIDPQRADPRLFTQGPPDPFVTLRAAELAERPVWRLEALPVDDPNGQPLGHALHIVVYPDAQTPDAPLRLLEIAHFETAAAVDAFDKEFNSYLMPGLLDGPELAVEVARLEGLPVEWKTLEGDDLKAYQNAELTLTRDPTAWRPYNPDAERDARLAAEGRYTDPIYFVDLDAPELDL